MSHPLAEGAFEEIACVERPESVEQVDAIGYWAANPDVARAGFEAREHFRLHGHAEGRVQWANLEKIKQLRERKLRALRFKRPSENDRPHGACASFLSPESIAAFDLPDSPPVSANDYGEPLLQSFRDNKDKLFLDVGAGLRSRYFSNVVNTEIYASASTDVLCVGEDLPFEDDQFDQVMALAVLEHTRRPWQVAQEICRVLKPGGTVMIDYPFLQPVHGYPHHYFNATPQGHRSLFEDYCEIRSVEIGMNQAPIYALHWLLQLWRGGLPAADAQRFDDLRIRDLLARLPGEQAAESYNQNLRKDVVSLIAAGSTLFATKKAR